MMVGLEWKIVRLGLGEVHFYFLVKSYRIYSVYYYTYNKTNGPFKNGSFRAVNRSGKTRDLFGLFDNW